MLSCSGETGVGVLGLSEYMGTVACRFVGGRSGSVVCWEVGALIAPLDSLEVFREWGPE